MLGGQRSAEWLRCRAKQVHLQGVGQDPVYNDDSTIKGICLNSPTSRQVSDSGCWKCMFQICTWVLTDLICWLLMHQPKMWWFVCAEELSTKICALCNLQGWQLVTTWLWNYPWTQTQNIVAIVHMGRANAAILSQHGVMQVFYHSHSTLRTNCACSRACNQSHLIWNLIITVLPWLVQQQECICVNYVWQ